MPVCVFEAALTGPAVKVNGVNGGVVLAKSGTQNNSTACDFVMLTNAEYDQIYHAILVGSAAPVNEPFDYSTAGAIWSLGFTFVLGLYLVSKSAGTILSMIRK